MGVPYVARNISMDPQARREFNEKEYEFLPVIEVGNSVITDYTGQRLLVEVLVREGYL